MQTRSPVLDFWQLVRGPAAEPALTLAPDGSLLAEWFKNANQRLDIRFSARAVIFGLITPKNVLERPRVPKRSRQSSRSTRKTPSPGKESNKVPNFANNKEDCFATYLNKQGQETEFRRSLYLIRRKFVVWKSTSISVRNSLEVEPLQKNSRLSSRDLAEQFWQSRTRGAQGFSLPGGWQTVGVVIDYDRAKQFYVFRER